MTIKETAGNAGAYVSDKAGAAKAAVSDTAVAAKVAVSDALASAKDRAGQAASSARVTATQARQKTSDGIDANPVAALIGGLALGALAAAVLPRTRKEDELLGDIGGRINDTARGAAQAAKEAGRDKLEELGINKDAAMGKAQELAKAVGDVARDSASAATASVKSGS